ncbi:Crp/Fnr family transcriptional regulator [Ferrimonas balearica]|uniref:Crp/Fnr family transcriptional regulator n=1 Tax=Ferrimonas balearica TaxID=44012 RepID=UPI001FEFE758|nr:Crp/Fnr family transcriptional regulator [Ferrimonas balearica]
MLRQVWFEADVMRLSPYSSTRFAPLLEQHHDAFTAALSECRVGAAQFQADDLLLTQGQAVDRLYIVPTGKLAFHITAINGRRFQLGEVQCEHHIIGEMEFFTNTPCQWSVMAMEPLQAEVLCVQRLQQQLTANPILSLFFASALAFDYQESLAISTHRLLHPIAYNIAFDLWQRRRSKMTLDAFNRVEQEAERFGTSSRVYRRAVKSLIEQGLVEKRGHSIEVVDWPKLERFIALTVE